MFDKSAELSYGILRRRNLLRSSMVRIIIKERGEVEKEDCFVLWRDSKVS
jgi:hypothetical protein